MLMSTPAPGVAAVMLLPRMAWAGWVGVTVVGRLLGPRLAWAGWVGMTAARLLGARTAWGWVGVTAVILLPSIGWGRVGVVTADRPCTLL